MIYTFQLDRGAYKPHKAHPTDAGYDLYIPRNKDVHLAKFYPQIVDTGVHVLIPRGYAGIIDGRSSFGAKGIITLTGVIDAGYIGSIKVVLLSINDADLYAGNRIAQIRFVEAPYVELEEGDVTSVWTERGDGGFGSTGA